MTDSDSHVIPRVLFPCLMISVLWCGTIHLVKEPNLPGKLCLMVVSSSGTENKVSDVLDVV